MIQFLFNWVLKMCFLNIKPLFNKHLIWLIIWVNHSRWIMTIKVFLYSGNFHISTKWWKWFYECITSYNVFKSTKINSLNQWKFFDLQKDFEIWWSSTWNKRKFYWIMEIKFSDSTKIRFMKSYVKHMNAIVNFCCWMKIKCKYFILKET